MSEKTSIKSEPIEEGAIPREAPTEAFKRRSRAKKVEGADSPGVLASHANGLMAEASGEAVDLNTPHEELFREEPPESGAQFAAPSSQKAPGLSDELADALISADAVEMNLSDADFEPIYAMLPIRNPKRTEAFRVIPRLTGEDGKKKSFVFFTIKATIPAEYGGTGREVDHILGKKAYAAALKHPTLCEAIRRVEFRLAVNSLSEPFFVQENLDDPTDWGRSKRKYLDRAEREWQVMTSKQTMGMYHGVAAEDYGTPRPPQQSPTELLNLTLAPRMVPNDEHPLFKTVKVKIVSAKDANQRRD